MSSKIFCKVVSYHLAPYIIIRDSFHLNSNNRLSTNIEKSVERVNHSMTVSEKRPLKDILHPTLITTKHQSLLLSSSSTMNQIRQINNEEEIHQRKKNYLLAEFESVLTQISNK